MFQGLKRLTIAEAMQRLGRPLPPIPAEVPAILEEIRREGTPAVQRWARRLDGFEGAVDPEGHRGTTAGWKASGLPWRQR